MTVHIFADEKCAYDACMTDESIENNDILIVITDLGERIIAFADTYPTVLFDDHAASRELHKFTNDEYRDSWKYSNLEAYALAESVYRQRYNGQIQSHGCLCI